MNHKIIFVILILLVLSFLLFYIIKNRPDYLVLLGIRGLLSYLFIQFLKVVCTSAQLPVLLLPNPISLSAGGLLGFPGLLLLYAVRLYLL